MKRLRFFLPVMGILLLLGACKKSDFTYYYYEPEDYAVLSQYLNLPDQPQNYSIQLPRHLTNAGLVARQVEPDKAMLGRVLFYDKNLSKDGKISCSSCHKQALGFSDDLAHSKGVSGQVTDRNSIALASVASFSASYGTDINGSAAVRFFWDNRAATSAQQSTGSLENPKEMGMHMSEVVSTILAQPYYAPLFKKAYGDDHVDADRVTEAIANFVNAMGSFHSKFDLEASKAAGSGADFNDYSGFTTAQNNGLRTYQKHCASCHSSAMANANFSNANNGLDALTIDGGVGTISGNSAELGCFKVPVLRNIALTAPYMHDGRFATLEEVVEHYNSGIQAHPNLSIMLKQPNGEPKRLHLTPSDKQDLIAFLNTLTDEQFRQDARFADPFKY